MLLALGRSDPLKNLPLTLQAWRRLPEPRPELCLFGSEPELASEPGIRYVTITVRRRGQRAAQPGDGVRADIHARGLLPAGPRVDGHRRRRGLHRRPRQPRLLRRRRELPDARRQRRPRSRRRSAACWPIRRCARVSVEAGHAHRGRATTGTRGSMRSNASCSRLRGPEDRAIHRSGAGAAQPLEILGHARRDPVEHVEADDEDRHHDRDRHRAAQPSSPAATPRSGWRG